MMQASLQLVKAECERLSLQRKLLQANENAELQAGHDIKKLDASVKKNTALIKKLRNITEDNAASLLDDVARTNQSKVRHMACNTCHQQHGCILGCRSPGNIAHQAAWLVTFMAMCAAWCVAA